MKNNPLTIAYNLGHKDRAHFDWPNVESVFEKVQEELTEFAESLSENRLAQAHELGDLLFTITQVARHLELDPSLALEAANERYAFRFNLMKHLIASEGKVFESLDVTELESYWKKAKLSLKHQEAQSLKEKLNL